LKSDRGLLSSKYYKVMAQAHHDKPIIDYILKKTGWNMATFQGADWDSHERAFKHLTRFQRISISKLIHNLSNTNRQNRLLYGTLDLCPGCAAEEETFEHVLRCSSPDTAKVCAAAVEGLQKSLIAIGTPTPIHEVIRKGFQAWLDPGFSPSRRSRPATFGSLCPEDILITQAYYNQFHTIGWYQFCLGRISKSWHKAVQAILPPAQPHQRVEWGSNLVYALWQFTKRMWNHRNAIVHGADAEETTQRILIGLRDQVHQHYSSFSDDAGYVLARHRYLFTSRTLEQRLSMSYDYVNCWLRSVDEARTQLTTHVAAQQDAAAHFFGAPAGHPAPNNDSISLDSDYVASSEVDTDTTSLVTHSMQDTTCTYASDVVSLSDAHSWGTLMYDSSLDRTSDDNTSSLGSIRMQLAEDDAAGRYMDTISTLPSLGTLNDGSLASLSDDDLCSVGYLDSQQSDVNKSLFDSHG
jgi:hypothetical protein